MPSEPGDPGESEIPLSVPHLDGNESAYLQECVDTNWVSSAGPFVDRFEKDAADLVRAEHAVATSTGTAALHIALRVAGVEPGDEVLVPSLTFIAPANAVRYLGAWPTFVDVDPGNWQIAAEAVETFLEERCERSNGEVINRSTGRPVRALLPVHLLGHPCDVDRLLDVARDHDLVVVADAAESLGAEYKGQPVGSLADVSCLSFNGNKIVTSGGGGMVVTDDAERAERARYLTTQAKDDPVRYIHREIGYNYRISNVQAALGCAQLEQLDDHVEAKRAISARYQTELGDVPGIEPMREASWARSTRWLYAVRVDPEVFGIDNHELRRDLERDGIQTRPLWQPLSRSPAHRDAHAEPCKVAEQIHREALCLPSSVGLTEEDQTRVTCAVKKPLSKRGEP